MASRMREKEDSGESSVESPIIRQNSDMDTIDGTSDQELENVGDEENVTWLSSKNPLMENSMSTITGSVISQNVVTGIVIPLERLHPRKLQDSSTNVDLAHNRIRENIVARNIYNYYNLDPATTENENLEESNEGVKEAQSPRQIPVAKSGKWKRARVKASLGETELTNTDDDGAIPRESTTAAPKRSTADRGSAVIPGFNGDGASVDSVQPLCSCTSDLLSCHVHQC